MTLTVTRAADDCPKYWENPVLKVTPACVQSVPLATQNNKTRSCTPSSLTSASMSATENDSSTLARKPPVPEAAISSGLLLEVIRVGEAILLPRQQPETVADCREQNGRLSESRKVDVAREILG